jgi:peptidoglycan/LPS O-acetylase OafA/YrhL
VNAFFLQTIAGPTFGSNGPLWSLAYEWWYYVLFPLVLAALWPIVDFGWRFFKGDRRTKIGDRGEEEILTTTGKAGALEEEHPKVGPKGEGAGATESKDTERTEEGAGPCLDKPSGAAFSNPSTRSELARDCENTSPTRSASGPVLPATRYSLLVTRALSAFVCLLAVAGLCWFLTWEILIFFGVWLLGASASLWTKRVPPWWLAACFLIPILIVARAEILKVPYGWQYLLGVAFALVIVSLANGSRRWFFSKPSAYLADFSYSVYLIHFPVLMFVTSAVFSLTRYGIKIQFDAIGLIWFVAVFQLTILLAWVVSLFTERKTEALRLRLYKAIKV